MAWVARERNGEVLGEAFLEPKPSARAARTVEEQKVRPGATSQELYARAAHVELAERRLTQ